MNELTNEQIKQQDFVDNAIFELLQNLDLSQQDVEWNIEMIAAIRENIRFWLTQYYKLTNEMTFYPYIEG